MMTVYIQLKTWSHRNENTLKALEHCKMLKENNVCMDNFWKKQY